MKFLQGGCNVMTRIVRATVSVFFLSALAVTAPAQTTFATITGTATDSTGAAVPGVAVIATHLATRVQTLSRSNEEGIFTIPQLREGAYSLSASKAGFRDVLVQEPCRSGLPARRHRFAGRLRGNGN
jgi:hypothetical protein